MPKTKMGPGFSLYPCTYLYTKRAYDNDKKRWIGVDAREDVSLSVNLPGVDLIKHLHQHKGVEDDGEVNGSRAGGTNH